MSSSSSLVSGKKDILYSVGETSEMKTPKHLYIITTARKRDTLEWEKECIPFFLSKNEEDSLPGTKVVIDSWNNISKYTDISGAFFIFDEQRVVGKGKWVKSFLKIAKANRWILLSATPGDTWSDYIPLFIANGFYKNRTEFTREHIVYSRFSKYPKVDHYVNVGRLIKYRKQIMVNMIYVKPTVLHHEDIITNFDKEKIKFITKNRWNTEEDRPVKDVSELCFLMRKVVNSDKSRIEAVKDILSKSKKAIVFYTFDYELELLKQLGFDIKIETAEWNGHKHQPIPSGDRWLYLVQYTAGSEGWNCITTDTIIFYSQSYSYKATVQAAGRIDRVTTPYKDLYYYHLMSKAPIDIMIHRALSKKKNFNESAFSL